MTNSSMKESMAREANRKRWAKYGRPMWFKITIYGLYAVIAVAVVFIAQAVAEARMWEALTY